LEKRNFRWVKGLHEVRRGTLYSFKDESHSFKPDLFNTPDHLSTQGDKDSFLFCLSRINSPMISALIHFYKERGLNFHSPYRAPFGGINCNEDCTAEELNFLLCCVNKTAICEKIKYVTITARPSCYNQALHEVTDKIYLQAGFIHFLNQRNFHIEVRQLPFSDIICKQESRRLNKCKREGFEVAQVMNPVMSTIYLFLENSFKQKQYPLSISGSQLDTLFNRFPDKFLVFAVHSESRLIAVSIAVRVNERVLYNFLMADLHSYRSFSPGVLLYEGIYTYCQKEEIIILDQGISVDHNGLEKPELIRFKKNLGGQESLKITYKKYL